tara:strand:+ start:3892 stop:4884 length:993 start_codon:yes stop_codon:yes gene_type:complete
MSDDSNAPLNVRTFSQAISDALDEELARDDSVFIWGEDIGTYGGIYGATGGLFEKHGPERVIDTPISETFIVGGGLGAALTGLRPVVELQSGGYFGIAMDELYNKVARWRYMHGGKFTVPMVVRLPEGAKGAGQEHDVSPEALFLSAFGAEIVIPSTPADAKGLLKSAIRDDRPVLFFEHAVLYATSGPIPPGDHLVPIGVADIKRPGSDVTVIAWSRMVIEALKAAEELASEGIDVEVVDPRGLRPLDKDTIFESVEKTGRVVIAHEAPKTGGAGGEVAAIIAEEMIECLEAPIVRVASKDVTLPQSRHLQQYVLPQAAQIVDAVRSIS